MSIMYRPITPGIRWVKLIVVKIVFIVLGRAFQSASIHDSNIKEEIKSWYDGMTIMMKVLPDGPSMGLLKENKRIRFRGAKLQHADLEIYFKNLQCAFMVLTPTMGAHQAFAEKRMSIKGDLSIAVSFTRALTVILGTLYPGFIVKRLVKRPPRVDFKRLGLRVWLYTFGIILGK